MKVFLTGGTGFIGQPLAQALLARGWTVVTLVRQPDSPPAHALTKMGAQCVAGDVTDRDSLRAGMTGADLVVHNAAFRSPSCALPMWWGRTTIRCGAISCGHI